MNIYVPRIAITSLCAFALLTLWDITVCGLFEPPSLNASHFIAGAGKTSIVVRFGLVVTSVISLLMWIRLRRDFKSTMANLGMTVLVIVTFLWSAVGLERFADEYHEGRFDEIVDQFNSGKSIHADHINAALGYPLIIGRQDILADHRPHSEAWLYSYMPSCGYGWHKRLIYFTSDNVMVDYLKMDEP